MAKPHPDLKGDRCPECNGKRTVIAIMEEGLGVEIDCPMCYGTGLVNSPNACTVCHGSSSVIVGGVFEVDCSHCNGVGLEPEKPKLKPPCHPEGVIAGSLADGVLLGTCSVCDTQLTRVNPRTDVPEWLDGKSPWTEEDLRPIEEAA